MTAPRVEIVAIGDELTHGSCVDTNSAHIASTLEAAGCAIARFHVVSDAPRDVAAVLVEASARADVVVATGGLGPTEDDRTRHCAAAAAGVELEFDAASWAAIGAWFASRGRRAGDDNRRQALLPRGAEPLLNEWGTAPGFVLPLGRSQFFALPGVPAEMRAMLEHRVLPRLRARFAGRLHSTAHRLLVVLGPTEAALGERLADLMGADSEVKVGITPHLGLLTVRVVAAGADAAARADAVAATVRERAGRELLFEGDATPARQLIETATRQGVRIATAESCTGGMIAQMLTDPPGSSRAFVGGFVTYSDERKLADLSVPRELLERCGAVSQAVAGAMAAGAAARAGAELAMATTGIAGPDGGTATKPVGTVCFGIWLRGSVTTWTRRITAVSREFVRTRAAFEAIAAALRQLSDDRGPP